MECSSIIKLEKMDNNRSEQQEKVAVILLQYGGPDDQDSVQPFLFNLFNDPYIIEAPAFVRWPLAHLLSRLRAPKARAIYQEMGGGSTIKSYTQSQADELGTVLNSQQFGLGEVKTFVAMRYWHPLSLEAVKQVQAFNPDKVVLLPLYPQYSRATTGSSYRVWQQACEKLNYSVPTWLICCYPDEPGFIEGMAQLVHKQYQEALENQKKAETSEKKPRVLFSAHGLPRSFIRKGDPYHAQVELSCQKVVETMRDNMGMKDLDWRICFQSKVGPMQWLTPNTEDEIKQAGQEGLSVVLVPIAFVSEHSETLVELDIEYAELAQEAGVPDYQRVPTINARMSYIDSLAEQVRSALGKEPGVVSYNGGRICSQDRSRCPCRMQAMPDMKPAVQGWGDNVQ